MPKGYSNDLEVRIISYAPKASCISSPGMVPEMHSCAAVLEQMPASLRQLSFVGPVDPHPFYHARLPQLFRHGGYIFSCYVLSLVFDTGFSNFFDQRSKSDIVF